MFDRRRFLESTATFGLAVTVGSLVGTHAFSQGEKKEIVRPPALPPEQVEAFVRAAHSDLEQVRRLLGEERGLVNATWDWGGGDFETALGGASHMGEREIALFLLEQGARMDLFAAAMLGRLEVVKAVLAVDPQALHVTGPHGFPLIFHARKGGEEATGVLEFLERITSEKS